MEIIQFIYMHIMLLLQIEIYEIVATVIFLRAKSYHFTKLSTFALLVNQFQNDGAHRFSAITV